MPPGGVFALPLTSFPMTAIQPCFTLRSGPRALLFIAAALTALLQFGCQNVSADPALPPGAIPAAPATESVTIREADVVRVTFPGAHDLDTTQQVRRDGKLALPLVGEVTALGLTPAELEKSLLALYAPQLVSKELTVTLVSSNFVIFVTGAVRQPGKLQSDRPITALEAVMEAGGFDFAKANPKAVVVVRREENRLRRFTLDLKQVLDGQQNEPFFLRPSDIVYVPEKFSWF